jgi:hypothetical protein
MSIKTDYSKDIDNIYKEFSTVLATFKEKFVDYYKNLDSTKSKNDFDNAKTNLTDKITQMYNLKSTIMSSIRSVNNNNGDLEENLGISETEIKDLSDDYEEQTGNSSKMLISDIKEKYKIQYVANISMFLGIVIMSLIFYSFLKNGSSGSSGSSFQR